MVELQKVEAEVTKEIHELGVAIGDVLVGVAEAKADGKVETAEVLTLLTSRFDKMITAAQGLEKAKDELKENPVEAVLGLQLGVAPGVKSLLK